MGILDSLKRLFGAGAEQATSADSEVSTPAIDSPPPHESPAAPTMSDADIASAGFPEELR